MAAAFDPKEFVAALPRAPGVYRMFGADRSCCTSARRATCGTASAPTSPPATSTPRCRRWCSRSAAIEVTVTNSETEALLLEYNLIKAHQPRFNVVLRDDKSFPYIQLCDDHEFPRLAFYRGARSAAGPLLRAVSERRRRARDAAAAAEAVPHPQLPRHLLRQPQPALPAAPDRALLGAVRGPHHARGLRPGHATPPSRCSRAATTRSTRSCRRAWRRPRARLEFERAAQIRDQLAALKRVQSQQIVTADDERDVDVFAHRR